MAVSTINEAGLGIQAYGNRNLIINGAMQVAQRGTSDGPNSLNGCLALDRWNVNASGGTKTVSQETFTVGQTDVPDFPKNYLRLAVTTGDNNCGVYQKVEDVTVLGGKTVTLSFWAKGTNPAGGSFSSSWIQNFGSGGSTSVETEAKSGIVLTSSWQKFTIVFDVPSISGKTVGPANTSYTWVDVLRQPATDTGTAAWTADIAQVQLEVGDTATPFEHRSYGDELAKCQRYYFEFNTDGSSFKRVAIGQYTSTTSLRGSFSFPVTMRSAPDVDVNCDVWGGNGYTISSLVVYDNVGAFAAETSTATSNRLAGFRFNAAGEYIKFDAEL